MIESAEDARRAVAACLPAPEGTRSYGMQTRRQDLPERPICWIQVETAAAMDDLEAIASVDGVDALYVGPADLGLAMSGEPASDVESVFDGTSQNADTMRPAFERVVSVCSSAGIYAGLHCGTGSAAARALEQGFQIAAVGADISLLGMALQRELATARRES
jgi:4-hydroxy-2-oxoheptanedioate aldolase